MFAHGILPQNKSAIVKKMKKNGETERETGWEGEEWSQSAWAGSDKG